MSTIVALATAAGMTAEWPTLALWWYGRDAVAARGRRRRPRCGPDLRPAARLLPVHAAGVADGRRLAADGWPFLDVRHGAVLLRGVERTAACCAGGGRRRVPATARGLALAWALLLLAIAAQVYLGRFERLFDDHAIFAGVTYTEAHVTLTGMLLVSIALAARRRCSRLSPAFAAPRRSLAGRAPCCRPLVLYLGTGAIGAYVESFIVKPNQLVREQPYITHNIEFTRQAYGLNRIAQRAVPGRDHGGGGRRGEQPGRRCRTSACGTGACSRTRCASSRRSAPTTTSPTSTSIATSSTARSAR